MLTHIICLTKGNEYWSFGKVYEAEETEDGVKVTNTDPHRWVDHDGWNSWRGSSIAYHQIHDNKIAETFAEAVEQGKLTWGDVPSEWRDEPDEPGEGPERTHQPLYSEAYVADLKAELAASEANQITLRDFFAGCALAGFLGGEDGQPNGFEGPEVSAEMAYKWADAMMAERDKEEVN